MHVSLQGCLVSSMQDSKLSCMHVGKVHASRQAADAACRHAGCHNHHISRMQVIKHACMQV
ncbi:hypothetical protein XAP6164_50006 [Xanthomonas phaseoli pv. phaseoli]|nr:hypothetical protein XAP6164_50006 [Xanthomonas phaseoli pv. phaseoli]